MAQKVVKKKVKSPKKINNNGWKKEIFAITGVALSVFFIVSIWFGSGGIIGNWLSSFLHGMFGDVAYLMPVTLMLGAVILFAAKSDVYVKTTVTLLLPVAFSMLVQLAYRISAQLPKGGIFALYKLAEDGVSGGVMGGMLTEPVIWLSGIVGGFIITIAILLIMVVLLFDISLTGILKKMFKSIVSGFASMKQNTEKRHEEKPIENKKKSMPQTEPVFEEDTPIDEYAWAAQDLVITDVLENEAKKRKDETTKKSKKQEEKINENKIEKAEEEVADPTVLEEKVHFEYIYPTSELLYEGNTVHSGGNVEQLKANAQKLVEIFDSFGIETKVTNITRGSSITRYEVVPAPGIKVNKITALDQDIALRLPASNVRIEVLPGYIGIEVSNDSVSAVYLRGLIESPEFVNHKSKLAVAAGRDINGNTVIMDIAKTPHLLIAGATGSGKSVCINTIIASILYKASPEDVRLVMVDPKVVELGMYNGIPHLLVPIVTDPRKAAGALCWAVKEMEERYQKFANIHARDLEGYNKKIKEADETAEALPQIVIIIDELADLMMVAPGEVQDYICRLAQKARAAGMHLVLATQRPSVDVITGIIKANIPSRISFSVSSAIDSRTILDSGGAEKLMGKGDMLMMLAGTSKLNRVQGAFVSDTDVDNLVNFVKSQTSVNYNNDILKTIEISSAGSATTSDDGADRDELFEAAADVAFELGQVSASMLQRRLKVGYARAGRLIDLLDKKKVISTYDGSNKPRTLTMSKQDYTQMMEEDN